MMKTKAETIQMEITKRYGAKLVCELPDHEFDFGGLVYRLSAECGHHSGRATVGGMGLWNIAATSLLPALR